MSHLDHLPRRPLLALAFMMLAALPLACSTSISSGGSGGGGGIIEPPCDFGCNPPPHPTTGPLAIALFASQMPFDEGGAGGASTGGVGGSGGGGGGLNPDTLFVQIGNTGQICDDPFAAQSCGSQWRVSIGIPPALQVPGVISLSSPDVISSFSETGPIEANSQECWGGGGSFFEGTLEIVSIDATSMVVRLANTDTVDFAADGEYSVERCFTQ